MGSTVPTSGTNKNLIRAKGWTKCPRRIYGEMDYLFLFIRVYTCTACKKAVNSHDPKVLFNFPAEVKAAFPFVLSYQTGIELCVLRKMISLLECSVGPTMYRNTLKEAYHLKHTELEHQFYSYLAGAKKKESRQPSVSQRFRDLSNPLEFSKFDDRMGYVGRVPSGIVL